MRGQDPPIVAACTLEEPAVRAVPESVPRSTSPTLEHFLHLSSLFSILVVSLHAGGQPSHGEETTTAYAVWEFFNGVAGVVRIPIFFFISGYLFLHTNPPHRTLNYFSFVRKKAWRLLLPYFCLSTLAFPIKAVLSARAVRPVELTPGNYLLSLIDTSQTPIIFYWFIMTLFVVFLIAPLLRRIALSKDPVSIVLVTIALLHLRWFCTDILPTSFALSATAAHLFFFWIGMLGWVWREHWTRTVHPLLAVLGLVLMTLWYMYARDIPYTRWIVVLPGVYTAYAFAVMYVNRGWRFLKPFERKSYPVYLLAWFPQQFVIVIGYKIMHWNYWLCLALTLVSGLVVPLMAASLVEKYLPAAMPLIGMRPRRENTK